MIISYVHREDNVWSVQTLKLKNDDYELIAKFKARFDKILEEVTRNRPKKLLIFINPFGGKGKDDFIKKEYFILKYVLCK